MVSKQKDLRIVITLHLKRVMRIFYEMKYAGIESEALCKCV